MLDGLHSSDFAKSNYVYYGFNNNGWKRIARISADQTGTFYINNQFGWYPPSPIILTFGLGYRSVAFLNQLGGISGTVTQARIVYSSNVDGQFYFEVYYNGGTNNPMRISYVGMPLAELYTTEVIGEIPSGYTSFNLTLGNNQLTGNSDSADKLKISRTLWGQSFNGEGNVDGVFRSLVDPSVSGTPVFKILRYPSSPYGLVMRGYDSGEFSLQSQRESNDSETFSLSLNPLGGNVGIGTTSPSYKLDVNGTGKFAGKLMLDAAEGLGVYGIRGRTANEQVEMYQKVSIGSPNGWGGFPQAPVFGLSVYGGANFCTNQGNVLIGTTTDAGYKLDVNGVARATRFVSGYDSGYAGSVSCSNWFRSNGASGWYNESYGGGIWMSDSTYVRVYNSKAFKVDSTAADSITTAGGVTAANLYGNINASYLTGTVANDRLPQRLCNYTSQYSVDPNTFKESGFAYTTTNLPANVNDANILSVSHTSGGWGHQLAFKFGGSGIGGSGYDGKDIYTRTYNNSTGTWTSWYGLLSTGNYSNVLDSRYRPMGGYWTGNGVPGTREFGFVTNDGSGEVAFKSNSGTMNMIIDGEIYCTDSSHKV